MRVSKKWATRASALTALTAAGSLALPGIALADDLRDTINGNQRVTIEAGKTSSAAVFVQQQGSDGDTGCNLDGGSEKLVISFNGPAGVTADDVTLTDCGVEVPVQIRTTAAAVSGTLTANIVSNNSGGAFANEVSIPVTITQPTPKDTTPPVIGYTLNPTDPDGANGWYRGNVSLTWNVTDGESTITNKSCPNQSVTADQAATPYSCSATSEGGTSTQQSVSIKRDGTAPSVAYDGVTTGTPNADGWYKSPVTVQFTGSDALSGPTIAHETVTSTEDGAAVTIGSPAFRDAAGNIRAAGAASSPAFQIDTHAPNAPTASLSTLANGEGWHKADVTVSFAAAGDNGPSGVAACTSDVIVSADTASRTVSGYCTDVAGNRSPTTEVIVKLDKTNPTITSEVISAGTENAAGWYNKDVTVSFECADTNGSGVKSCSAATVLGNGENQAVTGIATDLAGNEVSKTITGINVDKTAPATPTFVGGSIGNVYFGEVEAPTCTSDDTISGLLERGGCVVTGVDTSLGTHTWTATATDKAGNTSTATQIYTVLPWTTNGFYSPVDMSGATTVWNTAKAGSTIPLKFELFAGTRELTDVGAIASFKVFQVPPPATAKTDEIELFTSGATSLRYDTTGGQFIQNWKTPAAGSYRVVVTALDGSTITAYFNLRK